MLNIGSFTVWCDRFNNMLCFSSIKHKKPFFLLQHMFTYQQYPMSSSHVIYWYVEFLHTKTFLFQTS